MTEHFAEPSTLESGLNDLRALLGRRDCAGARVLGQQLVANHPASAAAHAALGDVAAAAHDYREAVEWYELAYRLEPTDALRLQLERARATLDEQEEFGAAGPPPAREPWLPLPVMLGGGFLIVCILVTLITVSVVRHRHQPVAGGHAASSRPATRPGEALPTPASRPAASAAQRAMPSGPRSAGYATPMTPRTPTQASTAPVNQVVTQELTGPLSDADLLLTRSLGALTWPNGAALGANVQAWIDPFTGYAQITFQVPASTPSADVYGQTLDMSYRLAVSAVRSERSIESLTLRALATVTAEAGQHSVLVAFRGNTNRKTLEYYLGRSATPDRDTLWKEVFATTWWNPSVPLQ